MVYEVIPYYYLETTPDVRACLYCVACETKQTNIIKLIDTTGKLQQNQHFPMNYQICILFLTLPLASQFQKDTDKTIKL